MLRATSSSNDVRRVHQGQRRSANMVDTVRSDVFNSLDVAMFMSNPIQSDPKKSETTTMVHRSKESDLPAFDSPLFKSEESLSAIFASKDWGVDYSQEITAPKSPPEDSFPKTFKKFPNTTETEEGALSAQEELKSVEWMPFQTLGKHVDVQCTPDMFAPGTWDSGSVQGYMLPPKGLGLNRKTDWGQLFMSEMQRNLSPVVSETSGLSSPFATANPESWSETTAPSVAFEGYVPPQPFYPSSPTNIAAPSATESDQVVPPAGEKKKKKQAPRKESEPAKPPAGEKKKRKRAPRQKVLPETKEYVIVSDLDVYLGRGGRSNHHPGNKRYRDEVEQTRPWYRELEDKDKKTDLSESLVLFVQGYGGRFLEQDKHGWFVINDVEARRKVSQALREDSDPVKRAAKRQRFLAKRGVTPSQRKKVRR